MSIAEIIYISTEQILYCISIPQILHIYLADTIYVQSNILYIYNVDSIYVQSNLATVQILYTVCTLLSVYTITALQFLWVRQYHHSFFSYPSLVYRSLIKLSSHTVYSSSNTKERTKYSNV